MKQKRILIVGAGLTGITLAERFASVGCKVNLIEQRNHIGGNCYDFKYKGVLIHKYGPHRFRTNSKTVKTYLGKFTTWQPYDVRQKSIINGKYYTFPINVNTLNEVFDAGITPQEAESFVNMIRRISLESNNSEDFLLNNIGKRLYEMFYKYYTIKQWGIHPKELPKQIVGRVPIYYDNSTEYVAGKECIMPKKGYTKMFNNMLKNKNIILKLNQKYMWGEDFGDYDLIIWTGRIDMAFGSRLGKLPYRSLRFEFKEYPEQYHQKLYKIIYPTIEDDHTRDVEYKYLTGQKCKNTVVGREFPMTYGEPFYPIPTVENIELYLKYKKLTKRYPKMAFVGRLAEYKYIDMDVAVENALKKFDELRKFI